MDLAAYLDQLLRAAGIPIVGVTVGREHDPSSWVITFAPAATPTQIAQAQAIVAAVPADPTAVLAAADLDAQLNADKLYKATVIWMAQRFGIPAAQAKAEIVAVYNALP